MKRYNEEELKSLLANTTPVEWTEDRIATVFRSSSVERHKSVLMAQVKGEDGVARSEHTRPNGLLMSLARNFAAELLDYKQHRYGQEDCCGCADRDAEIEELKERVAWLESTTDFDTKGLRRLSTLCGIAAPESDAAILDCAGTALGSILVEKLVKHRELECKECQQINFHEQCHEVQEKTAERCIVISIREPNSWTDAEIRAALKIKEELGIDDGEPCPACQSQDTVISRRVMGIQGDGQEADVTCWQCIRCKNEWSD